MSRLCPGGVVIEYAFFPLAFMWRHRLELLLKRAMKEAKDLRMEPYEHPGHHNLADLWNELRPYIQTLGSPGAVEPENVEATLLEFQKVDPGADGFRYASQRKPKPRPGEPHRNYGPLSLRDAPRVVNLRNLHEALAACANFLGGVSSELADRDHWFRTREGDDEGSFDQKRARRLQYMADHAPGRENPEPAAEPEDE